jgi:hypothetical protein
MFAYGCNAPIAVGVNRRTMPGRRRQYKTRKGKAVAHRLWRCFELPGASAVRWQRPSKAENQRSNMTTLNRRQALAGIGIASAAGFVGTAVASAAPIVPDPIIAQLGRDLDAAVRRLDEAVVAEQVAYERWQAMMSWPHPDIVTTSGQCGWLSSDRWVLDPRDDHVYPGDPDKTRAIKVLDPVDLPAELYRVRRSREATRERKRLAKLAIDFWEKEDAVAWGSGAAEARKELREAGWAVHGLGGAVFKAKPCGIEGAALMLRTAIAMEKAKLVTYRMVPDSRFALIAKALAVEVSI